MSVDQTFFAFPICEGNTPHKGSKGRPAKVLEPEGHLRCGNGILEAGIIEESGSKTWSHWPDNYAALAEKAVDWMVTHGAPQALHDGRVPFL